jgi:hemolysin III
MRSEGLHERKQGLVGEPLESQSAFKAKGEFWTSAPLHILFDKAVERMHWYQPPNRTYSRSELLWDRRINLFGAVAGCVAAVALVIRSWAAGDAWQTQASLLVFGMGMATMLSLSCICHRNAWNWKWDRQYAALDYAGITFMIMGSYTPAMLLSECYGTLTFCYALGILGTLLDLWKVWNGDVAITFMYRFILVGRFLLMGWCCMPIAPTLTQKMQPEWFSITLAGGIAYTVGVPIFLSRVEYHFPVWHCCVVIGTACMFMADWICIAGKYPPMLSLQEF